MAAQIRGDAAAVLPWEGGIPVRIQRLLGAFREPVLQLLRRDPSERISMWRFHALCNRVVADRPTGGDC